MARGDFGAVRSVRGALREALAGWGAADLSDTAELLATELVANALVHGGEDAWFTASFTGEPEQTLRVEVRDCAPHRPLLRHPDRHAVSGRGLQLVGSLATAWGVRPHGPGKTVWFELARALEAADAG